jgi:hypothetical protein
MAIYCPEKYERLRQYEKQRSEDRQETLKKAAPIVGTGAKLLMKALTKR